jgi:hypothetical protein
LRQRWHKAADNSLRPLHALQFCMDVPDAIHIPEAKLQVSVGSFM